MEESKDKFEKTTREQINLGLFLEAKKSFFNEGNFKERTVGFIQLAKLQQQKLFQEEIKIIFRRGELNRPENGEGAYLKGVDLRGIDLSDAEFGLGWANLVGANLEGANLEGANLEGANLERANLERANLRDAQFDNQINLTDANLKDAIVSGSSRDDNALKNAGVPLSVAQLNQLKYSG